MARKPKLPDKKTLAKITAYILGGAYPYVAAAAEGTPARRHRYQEPLPRGAARDGRRRVGRRRLHQRK